MIPRKEKGYAKKRRLIEERMVGEDEVEGEERPEKRKLDPGLSDR
jgi:hypothetical protein